MSLASIFRAPRSAPLRSAARPGYPPFRYRCKVLGTQIACLRASAPATEVAVAVATIPGAAGLG